MKARRNVSVDYLVYELWGDKPPPTCRTLIRGHVLALRRLIPAGASEVIQYRAGGYQLNVERDAVDASQFEDLYDEAFIMRGNSNSTGASILFKEALSLWRGPVFANVPVTSQTATYADTLNERRLATLQLRIEEDLEHGQPEHLVTELVGLVAEHPFREGFAALLMRALLMAERHSEALKFYARHQRRLREDLGADPGPELRRLHQRLLAEERRPASQPPLPPGPTQPRRSLHEGLVPAQTPPAPADFTGRVREIDHLTEVLAAQDRPTLTTVAISGLAGVGKTTLAIHLAHRLKERYPDGQLYTDFTPGTTPGMVLGQFLRALGVAPASIPEPLAERTPLYRSLLADRRVLVVVDNAKTEKQVRALLPGSAGCAVVVTSRRRLLGLEAARFIDLEVLEPDSAVELFANIVSPERVEREPTHAQEIVELCGRLPLAVRIAGVRVAARPERRLAAFAAELRDETSRLDHLKAGDLDVRASIVRSYVDLHHAQRRLFQLLGLLDVPHFPAQTAAALTGMPDQVSRELLFALVNAHLVDEICPASCGQTRYRMPELIRIFARHRANSTTMCTPG
ncbi:AfsR/SARP family transcriptional regulator [Rhizohabitans arisaemae]|uniref:AfsR/SARP family transcriptional regulator n=1 Tax=Rhizohabitans arisaemae TaxID=2720610 RepID=UPI0024B1463C|nr:BTAD domain-containing putative transcriptional regulator [Rhizohabitans arisaemae]